MCLEEISSLFNLQFIFDLNVIPLNSDRRFRIRQPSNINLLAVMWLSELLLESAPVLNFILMSWKTSLGSSLLVFNSRLADKLEKIWKCRNDHVCVIQAENVFNKILFSLAVSVLMTVKNFTDVNK